MSEYMSNNDTPKSLKERLEEEAQEYIKTAEFDLDMHDMAYRLEYEGKEIPPKDKLEEMVKKQYIKQRRKEMFCEKVGHDWKESNPDPENGTSDLDCQCCGEHQTIQWL